MKITIKVIEEDLKAALEAFRNDSFDDVNIFANRIMSNALFSDGTKVFLLGFFLKDVAFTFGILKTRKKATSYSTAKSHGFKFVELLKNSLSSFKEEQLWKEFHSFSNIMRKFEMDDFEEPSYSDNLEFTKTAFSWLCKYLEANTDVLLDSENLLIRGILNEMERVFRTHSGEVPEIVLMSLLRALDRYYDYFRIIYQRPNNRVDEERLKKVILPYIDQIVKLWNAKLEITEADSILWKLVKGWREFYIQRMELPGPRLTFQKGIELPEELKKKISESITEKLEKEL